MEGGEKWLYYRLNIIFLGPRGKQNGLSLLPTLPLYPLHPLICPGQRYNFITLHLTVCVAGRASLSVPANRGRWERRKKSRIIEQSGKPHHFIFIDGQLVKAMGYVVPSE